MSFSSEEGIICAECEQHLESVPDDLEDEPTKITCSRCHKTFEWWVETTTVYYSKPLDIPEVKEHQRAGHTP
jgi:DNA-directed RNA polymerase subunit RPC12/RpoP